jgi:hypothetical protein
MDDPANGNEVALRRLTEVHRETAGKYDERFLLLTVYVTLAACTRLVAPHVGTGASEADQRLKFCHVTGGLARLVRPSDPMKLVGNNH